MVCVEHQHARTARIVRIRRTAFGGGGERGFARGEERVVLGVVEEEVGEDDEVEFGVAWREDGEEGLGWMAPEVALPELIRNVVR